MKLNKIVIILAVPLLMVSCKDSDKTSTKNGSPNETIVKKEDVGMSTLSLDKIKEMCGFTSERVTYKLTESFTVYSNPTLKTAYSGEGYKVNLVKNDNTYKFDLGYFEESGVSTEEALDFWSNYAPYDLTESNLMEFLRYYAYESEHNLVVENNTIKLGAEHSEAPQYYVVNDQTHINKRYKFKDGCFYSTNRFQETPIGYIIPFIYLDYFNTCTYNAELDRYYPNYDMITKYFFDSGYVTEECFITLNDNNKVDTVYMKGSKTTSSKVTFNERILKVSYEAEDIKLPTILGICPHDYGEYTQEELEDTGVYYHYKECIQCHNESEIEQCEFDEDGKCKVCHCSPEKTYYTYNNDGTQLLSITHNPITNKIINIEVSDKLTQKYDVSPSTILLNYSELSATDNILEVVAARDDNDVYYVLIKCSDKDENIFYIYIEGCTLTEETMRYRITEGTVTVYRIGQILEV